MAGRFDGQEVIMGSPEATGRYSGATWPVDDGGMGTDHPWGGTGSEVMTGGADADVFVWRLGTGADSIANFDPAGDVISAEGFGITPIQRVRSARQSGDDAVFDLEDGDVLTLVDRGLLDQRPDDFLLV